MQFGWLKNSLKMPEICDVKMEPLLYQNWLNKELNILARRKINNKQNNRGM